MADLHSTVFGSKSQDDISCPRHLYQELSSLIDRLRETVEQLDRDSMSRSGGAEHETDCAEKEKEKNSSFSFFMVSYSKTAQTPKGCLLL